MKLSSREVVVLAGWYINFKITTHGLNCIASVWARHHGLNEQIDLKFDLKETKAYARIDGSRKCEA
jgi:hypothetical protein